MLIGLITVTNGEEKHPFNLLQFDFDTDIYFVTDKDNIVVDHDCNKINKLEEETEEDYLKRCHSMDTVIYFLSPGMKEDDLYNIISHRFREIIVPNPRMEVADKDFNYLIDLIEKNPDINPGTKITDKFIIHQIKTKFIKFIHPDSPKKYKCLLKTFYTDYKNLQQNLIILTDSQKHAILCDWLKKELLTLKEKDNERIVKEQELYDKFPMKPKRKNKDYDKLIKEVKLAYQTFHQYEDTICDNKNYQYFIQKYPLPNLPKIGLTKIINIFKFQFETTFKFASSINTEKEIAFIKTYMHQLDQYIRYTTLLLQCIA